MESKNNMIQLTQKGKEIYGDRKIEVISHQTGYTTGHMIFNLENGSTIASNPLELKALLDMGLIEIK